jgi:S-adenosylmethionine-diacylgycerolhomoserine-N-methlytransferase
MASHIATRSLDTRPEEAEASAQAARMDRIYRLQRHVYDATRPLFLPGRDRMLLGVAVPADGAILEIGCGTGRNLRVLAPRLPGTTLCGLDVSAEMLRTASAKLPASLLGRVAFACRAAGKSDPREPFARTEPFDAIVFSYSLSMMPDREAVLRGALAALAPEGTIHVVDFGGFEAWPGPARTAAFAWLAAWHVRPQPTGAAVLRSLGLSVAEEHIFGGYAVVARASRHTHGS